MKTSIDIDGQVADEAAEMLGTKQLNDAVNAALREVVSGELRHQLPEQILAGTLPVPTIEELAEWRARTVPLVALEDERDPAA